MSVIESTTVKNERTTITEEYVQERPKLKVSELDNVDMDDLTHMFGLWKEVDHCD